MRRQRYTLDAPIVDASTGRRGRVRVELRVRQDHGEGVLVDASLRTRDVGLRRAISPELAAGLRRQAIEGLMDARATDVALVRHGAVRMGGEEIASYALASREAGQIRFSALRVRPNGNDDGLRVTASEGRLPAPLVGTVARLLAGTNAALRSVLVVDHRRVDGSELRVEGRQSEDASGARRAVELQTLRQTGTKRWRHSGAIEFEDSRGRTVRRRVRGEVRVEERNGARFAIVDIAVPRTRRTARVEEAVSRYRQHLVEQVALRHPERPLIVSRPSAPRQAGTGSRRFEVVRVRGGDATRVPLRYSENGARRVEPELGGPPVRTADLDEAIRTLGVYLANATGRRIELGADAHVAGDSEVALVRRAPSFVAPEPDVLLPNIRYTGRGGQATAVVRHDGGSVLVEMESVSRNAFHALDLRLTASEPVPARVREAIMLDAGMFFSQRAALQNLPLVVRAATSDGVRIDFFSAGGRGHVRFFAEENDGALVVTAEDKGGARSWTARQETYETVALALRAQEGEAHRRIMIGRGLHYVHY